MRTKEEDRKRRNEAQNKKRADDRATYNEYERNRREKHKEKINARRRTPEIRTKLNEGIKKWRKENSERFKETEKLRKIRNKQKINAVNLVWKHLRRGKMIRAAKCSTCGIECKTEGHHDDYNKPTEVRWLCKICHKHEHGKLLDIT